MMPQTTRAYPLPCPAPGGRCEVIGEVSRGSVLIAMLFHGATNLFLVSPDVASTGDFALPLLAAVAKWVLVGVVIVVAGPGLARGPRPEALPRNPSREASIHPTS